MPVAQRREKVKQLILCYICLKNHNRQKSCQTQLTCLVCGSKHNTLLQTDLKQTQNAKSVNCLSPDDNSNSKCDNSQETSSVSGENSQQS